MPDRPAVSPSGEAANGRPSTNVEDLHRLVLKSLDDDQAVEIISIPLAGKSSIADHMVIASGRSTRQVASMATKLAQKIKDRVGRSMNLRIHDEAGALALLEENLERLPLRYFQNLYEPAYELVHVLRAISRCKD